MNIPNEAVEAVRAVMLPYVDDEHFDLSAVARASLEAGVLFLPCCKGCPDCKGIIGETGIL